MHFIIKIEQKDRDESSYKVSLQLDIEKYINKFINPRNTIFPLTLTKNINFYYCDILKFNYNLRGFSIFSPDYYTTKSSWQKSGNVLYSHSYYAIELHNKERITDFLNSFMYLDAVNPIRPFKDPIDHIAANTELYDFYLEIPNKSYRLNVPVDRLLIFCHNRKTYVERLNRYFNSLKKTLNEFSDSTGSSEMSNLIDSVSNDIFNYYSKQLSMNNSLFNYVQTYVELEI